LIDGFFVVDKPAGITSHDVVSRVRRILATRKVGHTGTLDPFATGVLPVAVNGGTKVIPFLDEGIKQYEAVLRLGTATDTLDMTGKVLSRADCSAVSRERFSAVLTRFTGRISQIPPMFSAIKRDGQPLYKLARQGQEVERQPREVQIHALELLSFELPCARVRVTCSRGTYVRSLADDIGRELGCGAALQELRRITSGPFHLGTAVTLEELEEACRHGRIDDLCVSPGNALSHLAELALSDAGLAGVIHGRSPDWSDITPIEPCTSELPHLARLTRNGDLVAVAQVQPEADGNPRIILKRVMSQS
jgi:tRNA pseudouridine55 synthase